MFGAGGGTSSYAEAEAADLIVLWGSNAREAHPIFFHRVLAAKRRGARLIVVDPRRTASASFADQWIGLDVGTDLALALGVAREIIAADLVDRDFVARATRGFDEFAASVEPWTLEHTAVETGVPAADIRALAHAYGGAERAQLCWTLGITEHHNGVDNVLSLINLALLCGQVGRFGAGLSPLRGQNNVQGGGDMGAIPDRLPGFQDVTDAVLRSKFERAWSCAIEPARGHNLSEMFHAMHDGRLRALYVIGENPAQSEADAGQARAALDNLDLLVVQDIVMTKTAEQADVVLPAAVSWCESEGTVTNSERRVQRVRRAVPPPSGARDDISILLDLAARLGHEWSYAQGEGRDRSEAIWNEVRALSPIHAGMSYKHLDQLGGIQWPCYHEDRVEPSFLHGRLWADDPDVRGPLAPFSCLHHEPPVDALSDEFPVRLTTGRRLDGYNTGVQTASLASPMRRDTLDLSPADAAALGVRDGDAVRVISRRGAVVAPAFLDRGLRPGLVFLSFHSGDTVDTNALTIDAICPKSGTAEFKAAAVRIERA